MHRNIAWDKVENPNPQNTPLVPPYFEEATLPVTHPEEVDETIGTPIEVEPLNETKLEEIGLNCNHNTPLSSREFHGFDGPEPQPLLNSPSLDVSLGDVIGPESPIKLHSPDSSRMKVVDYLTNQTPPSPHVANSHPKGRKAHLLEDKQIPSVGVFDEVYFSFGGHLKELHVTWAHLEKKQTLRTYTNISQDYVLSRSDGCTYPVIVILGADGYAYPGVSKQRHWMEGLACSCPIALNRLHIALRVLVENCRRMSTLVFVDPRVPPKLTDLRAPVCQYPCWRPYECQLVDFTYTPPVGHVKESEGFDTSGAGSMSSDSTTPVSPDHPLTHDTLVLVPSLCRTARMAVRVQPTMSPGCSARITEVAAMSDVAFCKRFRSPYGEFHHPLTLPPVSGGYRGRRGRGSDAKDEDSRRGMRFQFRRRELTMRRYQGIVRLRECVRSVSPGSFPISPSHSDVPSTVLSPLISLTVPSPVATPTTTIPVDKDQFIELYTRSGAVRDEIFSQRYRLKSLEQEQERAVMTFGALWRPVLALEAWAGHVDTQMASMSRAGYDDHRLVHDLLVQQAALQRELQEMRGRVTAL
ncbi:hypothetical protein Tco_1407581 [Tanacetum coccineum]